MDIMELVKMSVAIVILSMAFFACLTMLSVVCLASSLPVEAMEVVKEKKFKPVVLATDKSLVSNEEIWHRPTTQQFTALTTGADAPSSYRALAKLLTFLALRVRSGSLLKLASLLSGRKQRQGSQ
jgi:hypothetical protein